MKRRVVLIGLLEMNSQLNARWVAALARQGETKYRPPKII